MLVKTRKTIFADKGSNAQDGERQDGRRRRYSDLRRRLLHGLVATLLLGVAPAYAEPIRNAESSRTNESRTVSQHRKSEAQIATHAGTVARRTARARRNVRVATRQANKRVDLETDPSTRLPEIEAAQIPFDTARDGTVVGQGIASWYSADRYNKRTYSGVPFDENAMTAAHPWLPMGTRLRVTLQGSNQSIIVTINDRQGTKTRVIDLSKRAARELGILDRGIARVTLTRF